LLEPLFDLLAHLASFLLGALVSAVALAWRHRRVVMALVDWFIKAQADGRITRAELAELFKILGRELEPAE